MNRPAVSLLLTVISLGTRVLLAYTLAPVETIGVYGIWWSIPIGLGVGRYGRHLYDEEKSETDGRMMNYRKSCSDFATKRRNRLSISCCKSATISRYSSFARCFVRPIIFSHSITGIALFAF